MRSLGKGIRFMLGLLAFPFFGIGAFLIGAMIWVEDLLEGSPGERYEKWKKEDAPGTSDDNRQERR